jgi:hypothetical protein
MESETEERRPKRFSDCAKLYDECKAPNEMNIGHSVPLLRRRKPLVNPEVLTTEATVESGSGSGENLIRKLRKRSLALEKN